MFYYTSANGFIFSEPFITVCCETHSVLNNVNLFLFFRRIHVLLTTITLPNAGNSVAWKVILTHTGEFYKVCCGQKVCLTVWKVQQLVITVHNVGTVMKHRSN